VTIVAQIQQVNGAITNTMRPSDIHQCGFLGDGDSGLTHLLLRLSSQKIGDPEFQGSFDRDLISNLTLRPHRHRESFQNILPDGVSILLSDPLDEMWIGESFCASKCPSGVKRFVFC
jgi:hypothetical protein